MSRGLTPGQDLIEVRLDDAVFASVAERIRDRLAELPAHRIVSLSTSAVGEYPTTLIALLLIEYLPGSIPGEPPAR
ncbi:hypothetical protein [Leucobacter sp. M11]|uniref:hypothetical protein n=1 Tax=Leucobacter sp. M11 TaxID=2993565 RepID=UPI002D7F97F8|nr:hypothetical protein [Leucobacter sp. M11]MEB4615008.1 hypothetical protein [Leucobacter sp. M11]